MNKIHGVTDDKCWWCRGRKVIDPLFTEAVLELGEYRRGDNQGGMVHDKG